MKKRKGTRLPRLTMLAYSSKELARYSEALEGAVQLKRDLDRLVTELTAVKLELVTVADIISKRHNAAKQANRTRADRRNGSTVGPGPAAPTPEDPVVHSEADEAIVRDAAEGRTAWTPN